jgi:hypothetical protein
VGWSADRAKVTTMDDVASLAALLHETAEHHDPFEKAAPPHNWWDWYAAYMNARQHGRTPDEASADAAEHMAGLGIKI